MLNDTSKAHRIIRTASGVRTETSVRQSQRSLELDIRVREGSRLRDLFHLMIVNLAGQHFNARDRPQTFNAGMGKVRAVQELRNAAPGDE